MTPWPHESRCNSNWASLPPPPYLTAELSAYFLILCPSYLHLAGTALYFKIPFPTLTYADRDVRGCV